MLYHHAAACFKTPVMTFCPAVLGCWHPAALTDEDRVVFAVSERASLLLGVPFYTSPSQRALVESYQVIFF